MLSIQTAMAASNGFLHSAAAGIPFVLGIVAHRFGNAGTIAVHDAITKVLASGQSWVTIFLTLLPYLLQMLGGGPIDLQAVLAALLALIVPPKPVTPS